MPGGLRLTKQQTSDGALNLGHPQAKTRFFTRPDGTVVPTTNKNPKNRVSSSPSP